MKTLTLYAMSEKGFRVLQHLQSDFPGLVRAVVSATDPGVDNDFSTEIRSLCTRERIPIFARSDVTIPQTDYALAVSWRWLIDSAKGRVTVLHDSLLPKYRGFNPLVSALVAAEPIVGATLLFATESYDTGPIIAQSEMPLTYPVTIATAIQNMIPHYVALASQLAKSLMKDIDPVAEPQCEAEATYSLWRDEHDYVIDWSQPADVINRFVDAVGSPYKGAATMLDGKTVRVLRTSTVADVSIVNRTPGKVIFIQEHQPVVVCGMGLLKINDLRDETCVRSLLPLKHFRSRFGRPSFK